MSRPIIACALAALVLLGQAPAWAEPTPLAPAPAPTWLGSGDAEVFGSGVLRWAVRQDGQRFTLLGENRCHAPLTLALTLSLTHMIPDPFPPLQVVPPASQVGPVVLATFRPADPKRPYTWKLRFQTRLGDFRARPVGGLVYSLPWQAPLTCRVGQTFNGRYTHQGLSAVDVGMPEGSAVLAAREGTVVGLHAKATGHGTGPEWGSLRRVNFVVVQHVDGTLARYLHLRPEGVAVALGQAVKRGELLGFSGFTGRANVPHLHFEVNLPADAARDRAVPFRWRTVMAPAGEEPREGADLTAFEF